jgi:hypothetical protein
MSKRPTYDKIQGNPIKHPRLIVIECIYDSEDCEEINNTIENALEELSGYGYAEVVESVDLNKKYEENSKILRQRAAKHWRL